MKKIMIILFIGMVYTAYAQDTVPTKNLKPEWHKIGEITADFSSEQESIVVLGAEEFKSIKFKATDAPIKIQKATVNYESGMMQEIPVNIELKSGGESIAYDLVNPNKDLKDIKNVVFTYKTLPNYKAAKAHIELYGLK